MSKHTIKCTLSSKSIDKAIQEVRAYEKDFLKKVDIFRKRFAERIAEEAQAGFNSSIVDDIIRGGVKMAQVSVSATERGTISVVMAHGQDAIWVEFGAGVTHNGAAGSSPHPKGSELGFVIGGYGQGNGKKKVWGYYDDAGGLVLTRGTPATMPMFRSAQSAVNVIADIAKEVFG